MRKLAVVIALIGCNPIFGISAREERPDTGSPEPIACDPRPRSCGGADVDVCTNEIQCGACGVVCDRSTPTLRCLEGRCVDHRWPKGELIESPECSLVDATSGQVLIDEHTGLYWTAKSVGEVTNAADGEAACAGVSYGGLTGFRLPTRAELVELVDYAQGKISPSCTHESKEDGRAYCSSSPLESHLYGIVWPAGDVWDAAIDVPCFVRCVRATKGGPRARFHETAAGLVRDVVTRLDWQKEVQVNPTAPPGDRTLFTHAEAEAYCASKSMRLPTAKQLMSLVDETVFPAIDASFPGTPPEAFWTDTPWAAGKDFPVTVHFARGLVSASLRTATARVRCVQSAT